MPFARPAAVAVHDDGDMTGETVFACRRGHPCTLKAPPNHACRARDTPNAPMLALSGREGNQAASDLHDFLFLALNRSIDFFDVGVG